MNTCEIRADIDLNTAESIVVGFKSGTNDARLMVMNFSDSEFKMMDAEASLSLAKDWRKLNLRIFIDRCVLEVFANETVCATKTISPLDANATLVIRPQGGTATAKRVQAWPMKTIW